VSASVALQELQQTNDSRKGTELNLDGITVRGNRFDGDDGRRCRRRWWRRVESEGNEGMGVRPVERFLIKGFIDPLSDGAGGTLKDFGDSSGLEVLFEDEVKGTSSKAFGIGFGHDRKEKRASLPKWSHSPDSIRPNSKKENYAVAGADTSLSTG
jgi:hypothetical protein